MYVINSVQDQLDQMNLEAAKSYKHACVTFAMNIGQWLAYNLLPPPFPACPTLQVLDADGNQVDGVNDQGQPIPVCTPEFTFASDGKSILIPAQIGPLTPYQIQQAYAKSDKAAPKEVAAQTAKAVNAGKS